MTEKPDRAAILSEPAGDQLDMWVQMFVMGRPELHMGSVAVCREKNSWWGHMFGATQATGENCALCGAPPNVTYGECLPHYSTDLDDAWEVVDEMARKTWNAVLNDAQDHRRYAHGPLSFEIQTNVEQNAGKPPFVFVAFERPGGIVAHRSAEVSTAEGTTSAAAALAISRCALLAVLEDEKA